jgi:hypothetical protein
MSSSSDGLRCTEPPFHLPVELTEIVLGVVQAVRSEEHCDRRSALHLPRSRVKNLSSAHLFFCAEPQLKSEGRSIAKTRHIRTDFHEDGVRHDRADAEDICQIRASNAKQLRLQIKRRLVACTLIDACLSSRRHFLCCSRRRRKCSYTQFQFLINLGHQPLIEAIADKGLLQSRNGNPQIVVANLEAVARNTGSFDALDPPPQPNGKLSPRRHPRCLSPPV